MMQFNSAPKYSFEIDGAKYTLPGMSLDLMQKMHAAGVTDDKDGSKTMKFLESVSDKRTVAAVATLTTPDFGSLLKDWMGATGEAGGSAA